MLCKSGMLYKKYKPLSVLESFKKYSIIASVLKKPNVGELAEVKVPIKNKQTKNSKCISSY